MSRHSFQPGWTEPRKRKRTTLSCTECHRRKQKCDRHYPCCNCVRREKQDLCQYNAISESNQPGSSNSDHIDPLGICNNTNTVHLIPLTGSDSEHAGNEIQSSLREFGYSNQDKFNSISLLRATELHRDQNSSLIDCRRVDKITLQNGTYRKYTQLVSRLPPQAFVDTLIQTFFTLVNWQYDVLDEELFQEQLKAWRKLSYSRLQENLAAVAPEILVFPALLLQVLAQALLFHPPHDQTINGLMIMADMTFHDLGADYSDAGADILALLGKGRIVTPTVQAGLLRASFLKSIGRVIDAWHTLGATIRDAQEIGLHTERSQYKQHLSDIDGVTQSLNVIGQKIWVVLHIWDAHMAVVLGRPMASNLQFDSFSHASKNDEKRRDLFSHWQTENEQPRPFDIIIAGYVVAYRYFQDIHHLEHHDTTPHDNLTVERIHTTIIDNLKSLPSWCRLKNPSTRFDEAQGCLWLPAAREGMHSLIHLVLLTLHRPHIFSKANSRVEALKAGICILGAQERLFQQSEPHLHKLFTPVYTSFDAIILLAAICLAFPNENREQQTECIQAVEKGIQRLDIVGRSNCMARSAHGVASSLYRRLMHCLSRFEPIENARNTSSNSELTSPNNRLNSSNPALPDPSFDTISPLRPIHDLFYDRLSSVPIPISSTPPDNLVGDQFVEDITGSCNFEGNFSDASFWGFLNEFHSDIET